LSEGRLAEQGCSGSARNMMPSQLQLRVRPLPGGTWLAVLASLTAVPVLAGAAAPAAAQSVADFYRGKNLNMLVGTSPGGDYDLRLRMVARHIGRHIPG